MTIENKAANIEVGITDHYDPEVQAMLMAMYSRSYGPIANRLPSNEESVQEHKEKLGRFYTGYGHRSIGQLGSTAIWLEGVSQLAAKAIEYHPLFNGQESSTRYIDYSNQPMYVPSFDSGNAQGKELSHQVQQWQEKWRAFYVKALPLTIEMIKEQFPYDVQYPGDATEEQHKKQRTTWENTIKARAFDICGGFLPAGSTTNVGFFGTFDTLNDHFGEMLHHPCEEMRNIAVEVLTKMKEKYPYGTMDIEKLREQYSYVTPFHFYPNGWDTKNEHVPLEVEVSNLKSVHEGFEELAANRKKGQKFDRVTSSRFNLIFKGHLDFRSYRDLHRHRNGVIDMWWLAPYKENIHSFYRDNIPQSLLPELEALEKEFSDFFDGFIGSDVTTISELQYAVPMGYEIPVTYKCDLNQAMYILELRSGKTVHNTLRHLIQYWAEIFNKTFSNTFKIHVDFDKDNFTLRRGTQTFSEEAMKELTDQPVGETKPTNIEHAPTVEKLLYQTDFNQNTIH
jgi:thymidylate synthase ThyX